MRLKEIIYEKELSKQHIKDKKMNKVYCKGCKSLEPTCYFLIQKCLHSDNKKDTALKPISKFITEANKNNDCKLYEAKK